MRHKTLTLVLVAAVCLFTSTAFGDVVWGVVSHTAPASNPSEEAVLYTQGTLGTHLGGKLWSLQGETAFSSSLVNITTNNSGSDGTDQLFAATTTGLHSNPPGSSDTSIDQLTYSLSGKVFNDTYVNLNNVFSGTDTASFTVVTNDGTFTHTYNGLQASGADNWIAIGTTGGEEISSVSLDSRFEDFGDLHVSGATTVVPEPASLLLMGSGCLWLLRRRPK